MTHTPKTTKLKKLLKVVPLVIRVDRATAAAIDAKAFSEGDDRSGYLRRLILRDLR